MLICRYLTKDGPKFGLIEGKFVYEMEEDQYYRIAQDPAYTFPMQKVIRVGTVEEVDLLAPVVPSKVICVGSNYVDHIHEMGLELPSEPLLFLKPPSAVIGPGRAIEILPEMGRVDYEAELALVIGKRGRFISVEEAGDFIFGCTCANDVTERDLQATDDQWTRAKGFDTFCPIGPWIETGTDLTNVTITCRLNGNIVQTGHSSDMVFTIPHLVSHISRVMTLEQGDVILTGTPAGVGPIQAGDTVEVEIDGIGVLTNNVWEWRDNA